MSHVNKLSDTRASNFVRIVIDSNSQGLLLINLLQVIQVSVEPLSHYDLIGFEKRDQSKDR